MDKQARLFIATKAFIQFDKKILLIKESKDHPTNTQVGLYDIPGGRMKPGETLIANLIREVKEETNLPISIGRAFYVNEVFREVQDETWQIIRIFYMCTTDTDTITLGPEHDDYKWIKPQDFEKHNTIQNLHPAFNVYLSEL